jgi:hypothetical protein
VRLRGYSPAVRFESDQNCISHAGQFVLYRVPDNLIIDFMVAVPQDITHPVKPLPVWPWTQGISLIPSLFAASIMIWS